MQDQEVTESLKSHAKSPPRQTKSPMPQSRLRPTRVTPPNPKLQKRPTQSSLVQFLDPTCFSVQYPEVLTFRNFPPLGSGTLLEALKHQVEDYIRFKLLDAKITRDVYLILYPAIVNSFDSKIFGSVYLTVGIALAVANQRYDSRQVSLALALQTWT